MIKTLIFGAGYMGSALLNFWSQDESRTVTSTTTSPEKAELLAKKGLQVIFAQGDNEKSVDDALHSIDEVVVAVAPKQGSNYEQTYLDTAKTFCKLLPHNDTLKHLVYLSSTSVYGEKDGDWVSEESELNPGSENSKILCKAEELYLQQASEQLKVTVLRLAGIYGPGRSHESRLKRMCGQPFAGTGDAFCNWVHQEDIVRAIDWVLRHKLTGVYNLCSDDHPSKAEFYTSIAAESKLPLPLWDATRKSAHGGNRRVSNRKIQESGFTFFHTCLGPLEWLDSGAP